MRVRRALGMAELAGRYRPLKGPACCTVRTSRRSRWRGRFLRALREKLVSAEGWNYVYKGEGFTPHSLNIASALYEPTGG
jgi:hypothetical protein